MLARALLVAAVAWPVVAGAAVWQRASVASTGEPIWATVVFLGSSRICHQRPERSFHTHGAAWPVCARCSGLYLAAPLGGLLVFTRRRPTYVGRTFRSATTGGPEGPPYVRILVVAAIPTVLTVLWEWAGLGTPANLVRFASALPLGAAVMFALVRAARPGQFEQGTMSDRIN